MIGTAHAQNYNIEQVHEKIFNINCGIPCDFCSFNRVQISGYGTDKINKSYLFSFSLFMGQKDKVYSNPNELQNWINKYMFKQLDEFVFLLSNIDWKDYNIIHFVDYNMFTQDLFTIFRDRLIHSQLLLSNRYILYFYNCSAYSQYNFFGSLVRYFPLIMDNVEVVIFRDAHSTMPNTKNQYDLEWKNTWLNKTVKKFWSYQSITYNPPHTYGNKAPYAAAWAARKLTGEGRILTGQQFNNFFDITKPFHDRPESGGYGIDERLFSLFMSSYKNTSNGASFIDDSYIVGMIWLYYLFNSQLNPREFTITNNNMLIRPLTSINTSYPYLAESRCIIYYLLKEYALGLDTIADDAWSIIESQQSPAQSSVLAPNYRTYLDLINLIPNRRFLWDFLFNVNLDVYTKTIRQILLSIGNGDSTPIPLDYDNMCDIIPKYFTGGLFDYDDYINRKLSHKSLPQNIVLP